MKKFKYIFLMLVALFASSCSSSGGDKYNNNYNTPTYEGEVGGLGDNNIITPEGHKVIYTISYEIRIENEISNLIKEINSEVYALNGYIENSNQSLSSAKYVYKIPATNLNSFLDIVDSKDGISSKNISSQDVTTTYNEIQAEIETLTALKTAYENMLKNDELTLSEILSLNDKIQSIDTRLKTLSKNLDSLNAQIDYATITITYTLINKVQTPKFLGDYGEYLLDIGKNIVEFIAYSLPYLVLIGAGIGIVIIIEKPKKNKKEKTSK